MPDGNAVVLIRLGVARHGRWLPLSGTAPNICQAAKLFQCLVGLHVCRGGSRALARKFAQCGGCDGESDQNIGHGFSRNGFDLDAAVVAVQRLDRFGQALGVGGAGFQEVGQCPRRPVPGRSSSRRRRCRIVAPRAAHLRRADGDEASAGIPLAEAADVAAAAGHGAGGGTARPGGAGRRRSGTGRRRCQAPRADPGAVLAQRRPRARGARWKYQPRHKCSAPSTAMLSA